jgi:hypothetical protein
VPTANQVIANQLDSAANVVSGLVLADIGMDGHAVANTLWRIASHLRNRERMNVKPEVIRAWAKLQGHHVRETGRVPAAIVQEYYETVLDPAAEA